MIFYGDHNSFMEKKLSNYPVFVAVVRSMVNKHTPIKQNIIRESNVYLMNRLLIFQIAIQGRVS